MQMQRNNKLNDNEDHNNQNGLNNDFYKDDLYDYQDYFMGAKGDADEDDDMDDNGDTIGPLAINNLGTRGHQINVNSNNIEYYDNTDGRYNDGDDDFNIDGEFHDLDNNDDDMIIDTFFKKVDSLELVKPKKAKIIANYLFGELLGDGSYGKVKECLDIRNLCRRAVKIINLKTVSRKIPKGLQNVRKEIHIMKRLNHKNVIKLYDIFEKNPASENDKLKQINKSSFSNTNNNKQQVNQITGIPTSTQQSSNINENFSIPNMTIEKPPKLYIFMDYCMTSLEKLLKCAPNERLCNWQASFYFRQLIDGLEYLHSIGIIHNDIKPGNLLITCDDTLKICDFSISAELNLFYDYEFSNNDDDDGDNGLGDILNTNETINPKKFPIVQCTPMFQCPEMLAENLNERDIVFNAAKIDIWSSGVSLYQLTTGKLPFNGQTVHQIYENIRSNSYIITLPDFLDTNLKNLLRGMLNRDPEQRWSIKQIRESEWFKKKHPHVRDELAQWPSDVIQNETSTFRMLQYLEKLCRDENENETNNDMSFQITAQSNTSNSNSNNYKNNLKHQNDDDNDNDVNAKKSTIKMNKQQQQPSYSNNDAIKTYAPATKMKSKNCTIN